MAHLKIKALVSVDDHNQKIHMVAVRNKFYRPFFL